MAAIMADVRREHDAYVAAGGHVMTDEEWQEWWNSIDNHQDCWDDEAANLAK